MSFASSLSLVVNHVALVRIQDAFILFAESPVSRTLCLGKMKGPQRPRGSSYPQSNSIWIIEAVKQIWHFHILGPISFSNCNSNPANLYPVLLRCQFTVACPRTPRLATTLWSSICGPRPACSTSVRTRSCRRCVRWRRRTSGAAKCSPTWRASSPTRQLMIRVRHWGGSSRTWECRTVTYQRPHDLKEASNRFRVLSSVAHGGPVLLLDRRLNLASRRCSVSLSSYSSSQREHFSLTL